MPQRSRGKKINSYLQTRKIQQLQ